MFSEMPFGLALYSKFGDFSQKQGRRDEAIESYKKALAIDSNYEPAKEGLKKLKA